MFHHWGLDMGWGGFLFQFFLWIAVVALALWAIIRFSSPARGVEQGGESKSAMEILRERYARGEIDREEFKEKKRDLMHEARDNRRRSQRTTQPAKQNSR